MNARPPTGERRSWYNLFNQIYSQFHLGGMNKNRYAYYFLLIALAIFAVMAYFIVRPFLAPLIVAAVFAFIFQPFYSGALRLFKQRKNLAAFVATVLAMLLIILPIALIGAQIFKEASQMYAVLAGGGKDVFIKPLENFLNGARTVFPIPATVEINFSEYARQGLGLLIANLGSIFSSFAKVLLDILVFIFGLYFFLKDGGRLKRHLVILSPLNDRDDELIISRLETAVGAVVKGNLTIGILQGILTGIGFAVFGVPNATLFGVVASVAALVPGVGTSLVIAPAVVYLFFSGHALAGAGFLIWGVFAVGLIDNFLGPKLVGRGMRLHPLAVFIAVLGGLAFFGPLGFLIGPLTVSIFMTLIEIHLAFQKRLKKDGKTSPR